MCGVVTILLTAFLQISHYHVESSTSSFNYEVGARVYDKVSGYLELVSRASSIPSRIISTGAVNFSTLADDSPTLFFPSLLEYGEEVPGFYLGLESGEFAYYTYGQPIMFYLNNYVNGQWRRFGYNCNQRSGVIIGQSGYNHTYDPRIRPWYIEAKAANGPHWSAPYIDVITGAPVITFTLPLYNTTIRGVFYRWAGTTAADIFLTNIASFLQQAYGGTDHKVFIIDAVSGNLLGSSWNAPTSSASEVQCIA